MAAGGAGSAAGQLPHADDAHAARQFGAIALAFAECLRVCGIVCHVSQVSLDLSADDPHNPPLDTSSLAAIAQLTGLTALDLSCSTLPHLRPLSCLTALCTLRLNNIDCPGGGWRVHDMPAQLRKVELHRVMTRVKTG